MERIRVKIRGGGYDGQLGHVVAFSPYGHAMVVLDSGEIFQTALVNLLAVDNAWQWPQPPVGGYGGTATAGGYVGTVEKGEAS